MSIETKNEIEEGATLQGRTVDPSYYYVTKKRNFVELLVSLAGSWLVFLALWCAVISVFLPAQIAQIDPANKANNLALVLTTATFFSIFAQPLAGALSDRTRSTWGRRSLWILGGSLIGGLFLVGLSIQTTIVGILICWIGVAVILNFANGPLATVIADRFEPDRRGVASGIIGASQTAGGTIGVIVAGSILTVWNVAAGYIIFAVAIVAVCWLFVFFNREPSTVGIAREPFRWSTFIKGFWVSPRKYPDFGWAFWARFLMYLGYQGTAAYLLYILSDYVGLGLDGAASAIGAVSTVQMVGLIISGLISGWLSDRFGRRKPFVFAATILIAIALAMPILIPSMTGIYLYAIFMGFGYGCYMSIDLALMSQVLPKGGADAGKDMGVLTIATQVPQTIAPVICAALLATFSQNYVSVFIFGMVAVFLSSFLILPIKSVK